MYLKKKESEKEPEESKEKKLEKIKDEFKNCVRYIENEIKDITKICLKIILIF